MPCVNYQRVIDPILEVIQQCQIVAYPRLSMRSLAVLSSMERCALLALQHFVFDRVVGKLLPRIAYAIGAAHGSF